jgi:hypothetical protein
MGDNSGQDRKSQGIGRGCPVSAAVGRVDVRNAPHDGGLVSSRADSLPEIPPKRPGDPPPSVATVFGEYLGGHLTT